jgi:hypothetical protein
MGYFEQFEKTIFWNSGSYLTSLPLVKDDSLVNLVVTELSLLGRPKAPTEESLVRLIVTAGVILMLPKT